MDTLPKPEETPDMVTIEGTIVKRRLQPGSKSDHIGYLLIKSEDATELIIEHILDDFWQFEHVKKFEDKIVKATGRIWRKKFLVEKVEEVK